MLGDWVVGVFLRFASNGPATMQRLAASADAANAALLRQQGIISRTDAAMLRYQRRMDEVRLAQLRFATTSSAMIAGVGIIGMADAVKNAGELQRVLIGIQNVTGATRAQMGAFYNQAFDLGNQYGMSPTAAAEVMRTTVRMSVGQLTRQQMLQVSPYVAEFAMLMQQNRGIDVNRGAQVGISLAHMFRAYTPDKLRTLLDMNLRMSEMMGEDPEAAQRQMAYYMPLFKGLNVSDDASLGMMALLSRAGFRNKVGTNVRAFLLETLGPLQLTQFAQSGKNSMLHAMGITDESGNIQSRFTKNGKYDMFGVLYQMAGWEKEQLSHGKTLADIYKVLYGTFGKQGGTIAALFSDPQMVRFLGSIKAYLNNPAVSMDEQSRRTQTGFLFQAGRAGQNIGADAIELAYPWLKDLTSATKNLADAAHNFQAWLHKHPSEEKGIGSAIAWTTGVFGARAGLGVFQLLSKFGAFKGGVGGFLMKASGLDVITGFFNGARSKLIGFVDYLFNPATGKFIGPIVDVTGKFGPFARLFGNFAVDLGVAATGLTRLVTGPLGFLLMLTGSDLRAAGGKRQDHAGRTYFGSSWNAKQFAQYIYARGLNVGTNADGLPYVNMPLYTGANSPKTQFVLTSEVLQDLFKLKTQNAAKDLKPDVHVHGNVMLVLPQGTKPQDAPAFLQSWAQKQGQIKTVPSVPFGSFAAAGNGG